MSNPVPFVIAILTGLIPAFCAGFVAAAIVIVVLERLPSVRAARMRTPPLPDWLRATAVMFGLAAACVLLTKVLGAAPHPKPGDSAARADLEAARFVIILFGVMGGILGGWAAGAMRSRQRPARTPDGGPGQG